ncbi:tetratricopeptide repeat protein [Pseudomarimonas arenosa]|uniref:Tetratricopeptide repeat protein n=1 Tax=Pseudomarimonas arenosa TaxID=2774145 RepID=A0AAW3ZKM6_9GAMM|nr:tetratricopeptide repeat protein [Pseudomarimonas arenosa]MBD8524996.1 tetratricopeptide repeat protein [Pseudomarimonas arenosa]
MNTASQPSVWSSAWRELRRRKVVRAGATYALIAWVILQLGEITFEPLGLPPRALTWTILAAILGFPIVLVLAWFFDLGPRGITLDRSPAARAGAWLAVVLVLLTTTGVGVWLVQLYSEEAPDTELASAAASNSIAVLPFADMSASRDQSFLGDGIAEELLDRLARDSRLQVAARTSSFALREHVGDIKLLAQKLAVRWIVEGSVRKAGNRIRVTAQLIDASTGYHAWSETYERDDSDLFALQDDVTEAIAGQLGQRLQLGEQSVASAGHGGTESAEAHQAFLAGRQAWRLRTPQSLAKAERLFSEAVKLDANFARAWAGLADTFLLQADYSNRSIREAIQLAEPAAVRAVTLAPGLGEAWASLGLLRMSAGQLEPAERSLREAVRLDPRYEMAPMWLASVLGRRGQLERQAEVLQQALQLNPLEPVININLAQALQRLGRFDQAEQQLQRLLAVTPDEPSILRTLAQLQRQRGELAQALAGARRAYQLDHHSPTSGEELVHCLLQLGAFDRVDEVLRELEPSGDVVLLLRQLRALYSEQPTWVPALKAWMQGMSPDELKLHPGPVSISLWAAHFDDPDAGLAMAAAILDQEDRSADELGVRSLRDGILQARGGLTEQQRQFWREQAQLPHAADASVDGRYLRAVMFALGGQSEQALAELSAVIELGLADAQMFRFDPRLTSLRGDARLAAMQQGLDRRRVEQRRLAGLE